jgi:hypothetical protein
MAAKPHMKANGKCKPGRQMPKKDNAAQTRIIYNRGRYEFCGIAIGKMRAIFIGELGGVGHFVEVKETESE